MDAKYSIGDTVQVQHRQGYAWIGVVEFVNETDPGVWEYAVSNAPFDSARCMIPKLTPEEEARVPPQNRWSPLVWESEIVGHYVGESD